MKILPFASGIRSFSVPAILFLILLGVPVSCSKIPQHTPAKQSGTVTAEKTDDTHTWYYFTVRGLQKTDDLRHVPAVPLKPWTESIRITAAGSSENSGSESGCPQGYAVVNRAGILVFKGGQPPQLFDDKALFTDTTAGDLVFMNGTPVYSFYRNVFFNSTAASITAAVPGRLRTFLAQFKTDEHISCPVISYENLKLPDNSEITGSVWNGRRFLCSVKQVDGGKIHFSYISIGSRFSLLSLSPHNAAERIDTAPATVTEFRAAQTPVPFPNAPIKLQHLLSALPRDMQFSVECRTEAGLTPCRYVQGPAGGQDVSITATAYIANTWAAAVFSDGTTYFSGTCYGRPVLSGGTSIPFRLPKLPAGFTYGEFVISGTELYVAWEETAFFQTGRSGFIAVDLDKILYGSNR